MIQTHPLLNDSGIGVYDARNHMTPQERRDQLAEDRATLIGGEAVVLDTVGWLLDNVTQIKTPTVSRYGMKHVMEQAINVYNCQRRIHYSRPDRRLLVQVHRRP